jgi:hypothetical protein
MISIMGNLNPQVLRVIRVVYLLTIIVLGVFAAVIWRQLQALRNVPVVLPNYWFYVVDNPVKGAVVQAHGSWLVAGAPAADGTLETSTLECRREKMLCTESTATVSVKEGAYLEAVSTLYEVDQWSDEGFFTRPVAQGCAAQVLKVSLVDRNAIKELSLLPGQPVCKDVPRRLTLDSGNRAHAAPASQSAPTPAAPAPK